ncbi:MAG TPA: glycosyltransferase [Sedimentisphaerales bacterium]|nr:glycosyltransferase [Sedimentisphaerales bacterium]
MTDARVKVSVTILAYNHERFIADAIEGVLAQNTDFPYEVVVIDDGSRDGTRDVIGRYWERHRDRIRVLLNRHNIGARASIVRAYRACRGRYVASLDGDDYWVCPDKLQRQATFLDDHPDCALCFHSVRAVWDEERQPPVLMRPPRIQEIYTLADLLECNLIQSCSVMYRKGLFCDHPAWVYLTPAMDWAHHILHARHGDIGYIDEPMGVYRHHRNGIYSMTGEIDKLEVSMECLRRFRCAMDRTYHRTIARSLSAHHLELARKCRQAGDVVRSRAYARACIVESLRARRRPDRVLTRMLVGVYLPGLHQWLQKLFRRNCVA